MDRGSRNSSIALVAVILASLGAGWLVFTRIVLARPEPGWDEAAHAIQGALIAHDVGGGHLVGLLFDTYRQFYWTPLNSWLVAISFLVAGPSMEAARAVSTISYVLLAPVLFLLAETISPRPNGVAGTLAAALGLTLPGVVEQGALAMLEVPGMLLISGTLLVECRLQRSRGDPPRRHALVGIGVVLTFLMKTNIGVLLGLVLVLGRLIRVGFRPRRLWTAESLWAALPVAAFLAFWFAYPPKLTWTWNGLVNVPWGDVERWSLDGLLFYPRAIAELAGSWWMAILLFSSAIWAWTLRDRPGIEPLALLPPLLLVIGEIHHNKLERHILPMFPPMVVLAGVAGARIWETLGRKGGGRRVGVVVLVVLALLHGNGLVEREWVERARANDGGWETLLDRVSHEARVAPALVVYIEPILVPPPLVDFDLTARGQLPVTRAAMAMQLPFESRWRADASRVRSKALREVLLRQLRRYLALSRLRTLNTRIGNPNAQIRFERIFASVLRRHPPRKIVVLSGDLSPQSIRELMPGLAEAGYVEVLREEVGGTWLSVYRKPEH